MTFEDLTRSIGITPSAGHIVFSSTIVVGTGKQGRCHPVFLHEPKAGSQYCLSELKIFIALKDKPATQVHALLSPIPINVSDLGIEWLEYWASNRYAWIWLDSASSFRGSLNKVLSIPRASRDDIRPFKGGGQAQRGKK